MIVQGNCYAACQALYFLLGGKRAGWTPAYLVLGKRFRHWFLRHDSGLILDPTVKQFTYWRRRCGWKPVVDYTKGRGCGFPGRRPSKRARVLMRNIVWVWA